MNLQQVTLLRLATTVKHEGFRVVGCFEFRYGKSNMAKPRIYKTTIAQAKAVTAASRAAARAAKKASKEISGTPKAS
jgi:hypothetical protein